jgi:uncharacterized protein YndB with AHSA1/START domain
MTVTNVEKDTERLTLRLTAEFAAPVERVWRLWEDPRQLERWWGPPGYPATFVEHDFKGGGAVTYYMTSPEGETHYGWWRITEIDAPSRLEFEDGFGDSEGRPNPDMPTTASVVSLQEIDGEGSRTRMTLETRFPSVEAMQQMVEMGMEEGLTLAVGQIEDLLAEDAHPGVGV